MKDRILFIIAFCGYCLQAFIRCAVLCAAMLVCGVVITVMLIYSWPLALFAALVALITFC